VPVLLLIFSGAVDLGRAFYYEIISADGARDAARLLSSSNGGVAPSITTICDQVAKDMNITIPAANCTAAPSSQAPPWTAPTAPANGVVVVVCDPRSTRTASCTSTPGDTVGRVDVYYGFAALTPVMRSFIPNGIIQMTNTVQMVTSW
jgi:Flp pilus assembly protein TadG